MTEISLLFPTNKSVADIIIIIITIIKNILLNYFQIVLF